jgi:hypothetical protein
LHLLEAARSAVKGLEDEVDEILLPAEGLDACHAAAARDANAFWLRPGLRAERNHLRMLNGIAGYDAQNYAGPSGINLPELLEIERAFEAEPPDRTSIARMARDCQNRRTRDGIQVVGDIRRVVREHTTAFELALAPGR